MQYKKAIVICIIVSAMAHFFFYKLAPGQAPEGGADNIFAEDPMQKAVTLDNGQMLSPEASQQRPQEAYRPSPPTSRAAPRAKVRRKVYKKPPPSEPEFVEPEFEPELEEAPLLPVAEPEPAEPEPLQPVNNTTSPADQNLAAELDSDEAPQVVAPPPAYQAPAPPPQRPTPPSTPQPLDLDGHAAAPSPNIDYEFELDEGPAAPPSPDLEHELSGDTSAGSQSPSDEASETPSSGPVRWVQAVRQLAGNVPPKYDAYSRSKGFQGRGELKYFVTQQGRVDRMQLIKSSGHMELDSLAMDAIKKYKFVAGQAGWTRHPFQFELR